MPHLGSFRKGWESENLARFILSKFSFIAHPSTISDDIGSDFFCTLFQIQREDSHDYLIPKNSFAIQIKSNTNKFDVSDKLQYLSDLEIPFFVGVIDRKDLKLTIYSGQYISAFFSYKGFPKRLEIELCEKVKLDQYFTKSGNKTYNLRFPKITEVKADIEREELKTKVQTLCDVCSSIHKNIASRKSGEYVFEFKLDEPSCGMGVMVFAGSGSVKVFRDNFLKRLTEVFSNLKWIYQHYPEKFNEKEFRIYEQLFFQLKNLKNLYGPLPVYLTTEYDSLKAIIDKERNLS